MDCLSFDLWTSDSRRYASSTAQFALTFFFYKQNGKEDGISDKEWRKKVLEETSLLCLLQQDNMKRPPLE